MKKTIIILLFLAGLLLPVSSCTKDSGEMKPPTGDNGKTVAKIQEQIQYIITQNYGQEIFLDKKITYQKNTTIMDGLLETGAEVKTSFGGSFVTGINGLNSDNGGTTGERKDWFYYINGIFADTGALDYLPQPGEQIWWDHHPWDKYQGTPAVIGCFPEPFLHGYRGQVKKTIILSPSQDEGLGIKLQKALQVEGVTNVIAEEIAAGLLENRKGPTVVIGEWDELEKFPWLKDFNAAYLRNGTFLHFTENGLELLDHNGKAVREILNEAGVLMATGEGNGDGSPLWIITGTGRSGTEAAIELIINHPEKIRAAYSAVILPEEIIKLPLMR